MEILGVVAFIAVIALIYWVIGKMQSAGAKAVNRAVHRKDVRRERELWDSTWQWSTSVAWPIVRAAFDRELASMASQLPDLKVIGEADNGVRIGFTFAGTRGAVLKYGLTGVSEYEFQAELAQDGSTVAFEFAQVKTVDGVARCVSQMEQCLAAVERAVRTADPTAREIGT